MAGIVCLALISSATAPLRLWLPVWLALSIVPPGLAAFVFARGVHCLCASGRLARNVAVVGTNSGAAGFVRNLCAQGGEGVRYVGTFEDGCGKTDISRDGAPAGRLDDLLVSAPSLLIDSIVLCVPISDVERISHLGARLRRLNCDIYVAGDFLELAWDAGTLERLGNQRVLKVQARPLNDAQRMQKAVLDLSGAAILLVVLAPFLLLIATAIIIDSRGPVLFRQPRLGLNNRLFTMFKFRTMYHHQADLHGDMQATRDDPRVTRVGRFLRRTSLDELPQLFNVLAGDMSLVGPRPHAPATKAGGRLFHDVVADYPLRHRVKPGITGWAQVSGWRGETRTFHHIEQRVAHDLYYIDHWSLMFDLRIAFLTLVTGWNSKVAF